MAQGSSYYFVGQSIGTQNAILINPTFSNPTFTGVMKGPDGAVGAPSYSFTNSTSTGMYSPAANQLAFAQNGVQALLFSGSQAATFGGNVTVPAAGTVQFSGATKLLSQADGTLQVTTAAGAFGSVLLGAAGASTGVKATASNGALTLRDGSGGDAVALSSNTISSSGVTRANSGGNTALGLGIGGNSNGLFITGHAQTNNASFKAWQVGDWATNKPRGYLLQGSVVIAKTQAASPVTILGDVALSDVGTVFTNQGATGAVTFNLPTPAIGLRYSFICIAAQVMTVVTPSGSIFGPGSLSGATRTITGTTAANQYSSFDVVCYDGSNWVMANISGTVT